MEIASAAWAQWAGGRGRCLKEMGNPVRGEVTTTAVPLGCEPSGHGGCQSGLAAWASSSFSLTPCSGSPGPVPFDFPPFPQNLRMAGGRVCGRPGSGVLEAPVVQPNPAGSGTTGCLRLGSPLAPLGGVQTRYRPGGGPQSRCRRRTSSSRRCERISTPTQPLPSLRRTPGTSCLPCDATNPAERHVGGQCAWLAGDLFADRGIPAGD